MTAAAPPRAQRFLEFLLLRYRLQWAQMRRRPGMIVRFALSTLLILGIGLVALFAGLTTLIIAVQTGRGQEIAQPVFSIIYGYALLTSTALGFGMKEVFPDSLLRRYPLSRGDRFVIRHGLAIVEPMWLIALAVYGGCALGAAALGAASLWLTVPAALLVVTSNYLASRMLLTIGERMMATSAGSFVATVFLQTLFMLPVALQYLARGGTGRMLRSLLPYTPPFAAGAMMTGGTSLREPITLVLWCVAAAIPLLIMESRPITSRVTPGVAASWNSWYDRVASLVPGTHSYLIARSLRFYLRNRAVRLSLATTIPVLGFMTYRLTRDANPVKLFETAFFLSPLAGIVTSPVFVNQFGFEGAGFRRLIAAPVPPAALLRAGTIASVVISACYALTTIAVWVAVERGISAIMLLMLVAYTLAGLCAFHGLGLWSSVLLPARADYTTRRRQSPGGGQGVMFLFFILSFGAFAVRSLVFRGPLVRYWWAPLTLLAASMALLELAVRTATRFLVVRRERMLGVIEGRI
jgi:hypothetical protein